MSTGTLVTRKGVTLSAKVKGTLVDYTSPSGGPFTYNETVTGGTSSATGVVIFDDTSNSELVIAVTSGTFQDAETITGGTSSATATISGTPSIAYGTAFTSLARVRDNFNLSRTRAETEIIDLDTNETDFTDKIAGAQSASADFTINLVPGGTSFQLLEGAMDYNLELVVKRVQQDRDESTSRTRYYTGVVTNFAETDAVADASTVAVTLSLSGVSTSDPT